MKLFYIPAALTIAAGIAFGQQKPSKIGIIHIQKAIVSTQEGQKTAADLQTRSAPKAKELEKKKAELEALRDQLSKSSSVASEDSKQKLAREIDSKTKAFNRDVEDAQAEMNQEEQKALNELGGKMLAVIGKYAEDNGFALILDVSNQQTSNVMFAANGIDVTQDVIALYDKNATSAAAPVPPVANRPAAKPAAAK